MNNERIDELGYSRVLLADIENCSRTFGTDQYRMAVFGLYHDVLNLKDGPRLRDIVEEFYRGDWSEGIKKELAEWKEKNLDFAEELNILQDEEERITDDRMVILCDFIKQLLMDNGCIRNYYGGRE
jgi:hypothetical protein